MAVGAGGTGVKVLVAGGRVGVAVMTHGVGVAVMTHGVGVAVMTHGVGVEVMTHGVGVAVAVVKGGGPVSVGAAVGVSVLIVVSTRHTMETRSPVACDWATIRTLGRLAQGISFGKMKAARKRPSSCTVATARALSGMPL